MKMALMALFFPPVIHYGKRGVTAQIKMKD